jgi:hypothetical protein
MITFILQWLGVFAAMVGADYCWAKYTIAASTKRRMVASLWSSAIVVCGSFAVINYVDDHRLLTAAIVGAFVGTYIALKKEDENDNQ